MATQHSAVTFDGNHASALLFDVAAMLKAQQAQLQALGESAGIGPWASEEALDAGRVASRARALMYALASHLMDCAIDVSGSAPATALKSLLDISEEDMLPEQQGGAA